MKKPVSILVVSLMAMQSFAQVNTNTVVQPGNYNIQQITTDTTSTLNNILAQSAIAQKQDRDYLIKLIGDLNSAFESYVSAGTELKQLANDSITKDVKLEVYLGMVNEIQKIDRLFTTKVQTLTLVSRETLPSYDGVLVGQNQTPVATVGNINMKPLVDKYTQLRDSLYSELDSLSFRRLVSPTGLIADPKGRDGSGTALSPKFNDIELYSEDELAEKLMELTEKSELHPETKKWRNAQADKLVTTIVTFIQEHGKNDKFTIRNDNDGKARAESFSLIQNAFWARSYLRKKYGVRLGAIQSSQYNAGLFNLRDFGLSSLKNALTNLRREIAEDDNEVMTAFNNARNYVELFDKKTTSVRNPKVSGIEYGAQDAGILARANSLVTFLTGERPTAEVMLMVMRMVLADTREEVMLLKGDRDALADYHDARYMSTTELVEQERQLICKTDFTLTEQTRKKNCQGIAPIRPVGQGTSSLSGIFATLLQQVGILEMTKLKRVETLRQQIAMAALAGQDTEALAEEEDGLFGGKKKGGGLN
ncbi:MAG TPA: hypothetical protein VFV50_17685 [Bdellovibrionales bacterium]|nr:hypothetical protein [Bdellovibrionales bacterium]